MFLIKIQKEKLCNVKKSGFKFYLVLVLCILILVWITFGFNFFFFFFCQCKYFVCRCVCFKCFASFLLFWLMDIKWTKEKQKTSKKKECKFKIINVDVKRWCKRKKTWNFFDTSNSLFFQCFVCLFCLVVWAPSRKKSFKIFFVLLLVTTVNNCYISYQTP